MLRAVLFDMDDTLLDWSRREGNWADITREHLTPIHHYLQQEGYPVPDLHEVVEAYGEQNRLAWEAITPPEFTCPSHMDILSATLATCKLETNRIDMLQVQKLFAWKLIPGVCLFDDAIDVLKILRTANLKTGLITNATMPMWMRDIELKSLDLLEYLDVRLAAGDLGRFKPHPAPFREALKRLKIAPEEAIFVGDRVQDDVAGAQAAGMRAVWVRRGTEVSNGSCKPNATITSLRELPATLDVWYPGWR